MDNLKTVSEAAKILGVSADTIRRWDKRRMIKSYRSNNNHRLFNLTEIERINNKVSGKNSKNYYKILKAKKRSRYTSVELFAGAGGTTIGFHNAGINHIHLSDIDPTCIKTLKYNTKYWKSCKTENIINQDLKVLNDTKYFKNINADIVEGGFPCQAFSYAGNKLGFEDARGTLFYEFARCVKQVSPKIVIGENVRGLHKHDNGKTLNTMLTILEEIGYRTSYKILRAQYLDVPQKRERLIIVGIKNSKKYKDIPFIFPKEKDYTVTLGDALKNCPKSVGSEYPKRKKEILDRVPEGGCWRNLPVPLQKEYMQKSYYLGGGKTGMARRLSMDEPSLTLTCSPSQKQTERCHPKETRPLTVREYARIQTFPDDWEFKGSMSAQYKQIGNAVPVNLGYHIGRCVIAMLDGNFNDKTMQIGEKWSTNNQLDIFYT